MIASGINYKEDAHSSTVTMWMDICLFFKPGVPFFVFTCCVNRVGGRGISKSPCWETKTAPSNLLGDYGHPLSFFGLPSIPIAFNNMNPWLSEESGYDVVALDSTHILYWSIRYFLILPKNTFSKKDLKNIFPSFVKKTNLIFELV